MPSVARVGAANGRVYDPLTAQFFSPDPYVQAPDNWLNYNRYAYAYGNPFKYTDPSGEWVHLVIGAVIGGIVNLISNADKIDNFWQGLGYFGVGVAVGAGSAALGGWIAGATQSAGIITGAAVGAGTGAATGAVSNVTLNGLNNVIGGQNFWDGWLQSAISGAIGGGISGCITGGIKGYELAKAGGKNMWWGGDVKYGRTQWSFLTAEKPYETVSWDIKNVGSKSLNDCVPTSFTEANDFLGGTTSYDEYKAVTNYQENVGVVSTKGEYQTLVSDNFHSSNLNGAVLADPVMAQQIQNGGGLVHTNMPHSGIRHADNLRSIKYYHSGKVIMNFRIGSYRLSSVNNNWWFYVLRGVK